MSNLDLSHADQREGRIRLYGPEGFAAMRKAGQLAAAALDMLVPYVKPGVTTERLDELVFEFAMDHGAIPASLNYRGFPKSICTSVNHVVCHGIPGPKPLREGDIVNIDVTVIKDGWHGDTSRMYFVGKPSPEAERLVNVTLESMMRGIAAVRPGATLGDVGAAIQAYAEDAGFSVVRDFCGHGIGRKYHEAPQVLHYGKPGTGLRLKKGMVFTIEPMLNAGRHEVRVLDDDWTVVTVDGSLSAQWEHMVAVTDDGYDILTAWPGKSVL